MPERRQSRSSVSLIPLRTAGQETILITRLSPEKAETIRETHLLSYHAEAKIGVIGVPPAPDGIGTVLIATGGTSDIPVAEEAALTAEVLGNRVTRLYDVGVAGLHRLLAHRTTSVAPASSSPLRGWRGAPGQRHRRAGRLPGHRRPYQRGLRRLFPGTVRPSVDAQFLRQRRFGGQHRQWLRRRVSGQYDQPYGGESMKTLYLECGMGAAGDMLTAALLELLPDPDSFVEELNAWEFPASNTAGSRR